MCTQEGIGHRRKQGVDPPSDVARLHNAGFAHGRVGSKTLESSTSYTVLRAFTTTYHAPQARHFYVMKICKNGQANVLRDPEKLTANFSESRRSKACRLRLQPRSIKANVADA